MVYASTEVIDLESSEDESPVKPVQKTKTPGTSTAAPRKDSLYIDLTSEASDEGEILDSNSNTPTVTAAAVPPLNGVDTLPNAQTRLPPRSPSVEAPSSHSDTTPVKRNNRKKRSLNNPDAALHIRTPPPRARVSNAKGTNNPSTWLEEDEPLVPIKKPSFIANKGGLKALHRLKNGRGAAPGSSAPKLTPGVGKKTKSTTISADGAPKKRTATVEKVLDASLESLLPTVRPAAAKPPRIDEPISVDEDPLFFPDDEDPDLGFEHHSPSPVPPLSPTTDEAVLPPRRNPNYEPYSPTTASRGAGPSSRADWYVALPPAGWHSQSVTAYPYLPLERSRPSTSSTNINPLTDESRSPPPTTANPLKPHKGRKRPRRILSDEESDEPQPTPVKKRKYSIDDDDDRELSASLDNLLKTVVSHSPDVPMENAGVETNDQDLLEPDDEVDQLIESAFEGTPEPPLGAFWGWKRPRTSTLCHSTSVVPEGERSGVFEDRGDQDVQMDDHVAPVEDPSSHSMNDAPMKRNHNLHSATANPTVPKESEPDGPRPYFDPAERALKNLLDEYADVLFQYPNITAGYHRPWLSPPDAPWVILAPLLRRKLELERAKLQRFENGL